MKEIEGKKSILFITNNLNFGNGVAIALRNLCAALSKYNLSIVVLAIFKIQPSFLKTFGNTAIIKTIFGTYFHGLSFITEKMGMHFLMRKVMHMGKFDGIVAYQYGVPSLLVHNLSIAHPDFSRYFGFVHTYSRAQVSLFSSMKKIICISEDGAMQAKADFPSYKNIVHLRNCYPVEKIIRMSNEPISADLEAWIGHSFVFCSAARLSPEKRVDRLVFGMKRLVSKGKDVKLIVVGGGAEEQKIRKIIHSTGLDQRIYLAGLQVNPYKYMKRCDVFVVSSSSEGLCTAAVEASLLDKPILSTNVFGSRETVYDPTIGLIVENEDKDFFQGMEKALDLPVQNFNFSEAKKKWDSNAVAKDFLTFVFDN